MWSATEMDGMSPEEQAKNAIGKLLKRVREHEYLGYYIDPCTESFNLLTEAYATLTKKKVEEVRVAFTPLRARNPREGR